MYRNIIAALAFALVSLTAGGQMVSSSSLVITREKLPEVGRGYEQSVDASYAMLKADGSMVSGVGLTYIGGYRFNNHFFLGAGTGLSLSMGNGMERAAYDEGMLDLPVLSLPLFAYFRAYFLKSRVSPFLSLAAGGRFSTSKELPLELGTVDYSTMGVFVNPSVGVNYRLNAKHSIYFAAGWTCSSVPSVKDVTPESATVYGRMASVLDVHVGFTF